MKLHLFAEKFDKSWELVEQPESAAPFELAENPGLYSILNNNVPGPFRPILKENRGVPPDCSAEYLLHACGDSFDHSWLRLEEIVEIDWNRHTKTFRALGDYPLQLNESPRVYCAQFLNQVVPKLLELAGDNPAAVRAVYHFVSS